MIGLDAFYNKATKNPDQDDAANYQTIYHLYETYSNDQEFSLNHVEIAHHRHELQLSYDFWGNELDQINPASFKFLLPYQREALGQQLRFAFYIFSAVYKINQVEARLQVLKRVCEQLFHCACLLDKLQRSDNSSMEQYLQQELPESDKHLKYLGLTVLAPIVAKKILEFTGAGKTSVIVNWMTELNGQRLKWVWVNSFLSCVISMLPSNFAHIGQTEKAIAAPSMLTGYMSWVLYYFRFGINLCLLLKHTLQGPWMSKEERQIPASERFKTQWNQRKFALLNDSIWGTANMVCFFWLVGNGMLGYGGNLLTTLLLLMDTTLCAWGFWEESTQHNDDLRMMNLNISQLQHKINITQGVDEILILKCHLDKYIKQRDQLILDWKYKKYALINDLTYAAGLLAAFSIMCCLLFPPGLLAPAATLILGVAGAALCFTLTTTCAAIRGSIDISKMNTTLALTENEYSKTKTKFTKRHDELGKNRLYLELLRLDNTKGYQRQQINYQKLQLVRSVVTDALVPLTVFLTFTFMPLGIAIAVLAAGIALAILTNYLIKQFEPKAQPLPEYKPDDYQQFAAGIRSNPEPQPLHNPALLFAKQSTQHRSFLDAFESNGENHTFRSNDVIVSSS